MMRLPAWPALAVVTAGAAALALVPPPALARADFDRSEPPRGLAVPEAPERVDIWFTEALSTAAGANAIEVFAPDGGPAHAGLASVDGADSAHLSVELRPGLPQGRYRVEWRTLSAVDGAAAEGSFEFVVHIHPSETATAGPSIAGGGGGSVPRWALLSGAAIAAAAGLGAWALLRGGGPERTP
jgi:methionine-rich copper-binding protein CopC